MERIYTIETRLSLNEQQKDYLNSYITDYNKIYRIMWHQMSDSKFSFHYPKSSNYITYICNKFNILKRTANTIYRSVKGRQKAYIELKRTEEKALEGKIIALEDTISKLKYSINKLKPKVTENKAAEKELSKAQYNKLIKYGDAATLVDLARYYKKEKPKESEAVRRNADQAVKQDIKAGENVRKAQHKVDTAAINKYNAMSKERDLKIKTFITYYFFIYLALLVLPILSITPVFTISPKTRKRKIRKQNLTISILKP